MKESIFVFREIGTEFQQVGTLAAVVDGVAFSYASSYLSASNVRAISSSLPLISTQFGSFATNFSSALEKAKLKLLEEGYSEAGSFAQHILEGFVRRRDSL